MHADIPDIVYETYLIPENEYNVMREKDALWADFIECSTIFCCKLHSSRKYLSHLNDSTPLSRLGYILIKETQTNMEDSVCNIDWCYYKG